MHLKKPWQKHQCWCKQAYPVSAHFQQLPRKLLTLLKVCLITLISNFSVPKVCKVERRQQLKLCFSVPQRSNRWPPELTPVRAKPFTICWWTRTWHHSFKRSYFFHLKLLDAIRTISSSSISVFCILLTTLPFLMSTCPVSPATKMYRCFFLSMILHDFHRSKGLIQHPLMLEEETSKTIKRGK